MSRIRFHPSRSSQVLACLLGLSTLTAALRPAGGARAVQEGESAERWERQRPEFERIARSLAQGPAPYLGVGRRPEFERALENPALTPGQRIELETKLGRALLKEGDIVRALEVLEAAAARVEGMRGAPLRKSVHRTLGLAYLRQAETENCVLRHNSDCCIFPLEDGAVHLQRGPAENARRAYTRVLELDPGDLEARWLLNLVAMALGDYPFGVPERERIPRSAFASESSVGRFRDVAPALGVDTFNLCGGVVAEDFDGDGLIDILTSTYDPAGPLSLYANRGDGTFDDRSDASRASDQLGGLNLIAGDVDNDGDRDVFVLRGAWLFDAGRIRNSLLRNDDGVFTDVTRAAGVAEPACPSQAGVFGDFDGDGNLDLYVGNESRVQTQRTADYPSQLFWNQGLAPEPIRFEDGAAAAEAENDGYCKGVAAGDYDNDGDLDLYLSNIGPNRLYRNEGARTFVDDARRAGVVQPQARSFACWFFDHDNDGWLDLFVAAYEASLADLTAEALDQPHQAVYPRLYRNQNGSFRDIARSTGLDRVVLPMGANFGDLDNDGWLDMYLTTGEPQLQSLMPNVMLKNDGGRRYVDVTSSGGFGHLQKGHGIAFADFDHDGDQDIYHQLGGFFPVDRFHNVLFENPGSGKKGHRWLYLKLVGTRSNRDAVGARIRVSVRSGEARREIHRAVGAVSSFGGSPIRQEIGLGAADGIDALVVLWPSSGEPQLFEDVPLDAFLVVTEGEEDYEEVELESFAFE